MIIDKIQDHRASEPTRLANIDNIYLINTNVCFYVMIGSKTTGHILQKIFHCWQATLFPSDIDHVKIFLVVH